MSRRNPKCGILTGKGLRQRPPSRAEGGAGRVIKQRSRAPPAVAASSPQGAAGSGLDVSLRDPCCSSRLARGGSEPAWDRGVMAQGPHGPLAASPGASCDGSVRLPCGGQGACGGHAVSWGPSLPRRRARRRFGGARGRSARVVYISDNSSSNKMASCPIAGFHGNTKFPALGRREQPWRRSLAAACERGAGTGGSPPRAAGGASAWPGTQEN